jgi:hypothetical protein
MYYNFFVSFSHTKKTLALTKEPKSQDSNPHLLQNNRPLRRKNNSFAGAFGVGKHNNKKSQY